MIARQAIRALSLSSPRVILGCEYHNVEMPFQRPTGMSEKGSLALAGVPTSANRPARHNPR
jgi:hypothetical protein